MCPRPPQKLCADDDDDSVLPHSSSSLVYFTLLSVPQCLCVGPSAGSLGFNSHIEAPPLRRAPARAWPARVSTPPPPRRACVSKMMHISSLQYHTRTHTQAGRRRRAFVEGSTVAKDALSLTVCDSLRLHASRCLLQPLFQSSIPP